MCTAIPFKFLQLFVCIKLYICLCTEKYLEGYICIPPFTPFPLKNGIQGRILGGLTLFVPAGWCKRACVSSVIKRKKIVGYGNEEGSLPSGSSDSLDCGEQRPIALGGMDRRDAQAVYRLRRSFQKFSGEQHF